MVNNASEYYNWLEAKEPTEYDRFTNSLGQVVVLAEHPTMGDTGVVVAIFPEWARAFDTDFFDTEDLTEVGGDYEPLLVNGELWSGYEMME